MEIITLYNLLNQINNQFSSTQVTLEWLRTPHPSLGTSPLIVISQGRQDEVLWLISSNLEIEA